MKDGIFVWLPIDTNVNAPTYEIPTIENQKDKIVRLISPTQVQNPENQNTNIVEEEEEEEHHFYQQQENDPRTKKMTAFYSEWIDIMSFSHNVASAEGRRGRGEPHVGELTLTKFTCERSPSLNYMALRGELVPHCIVRVCGKVKEDSHVIPIIEYELHHVTVTNVSISGGSGGKPVETLSLACKIINIKHIKLNVESGEFEVYQVSKWDNLKKTGSKTIYSSKKGEKSNGGAMLLELAKKRLMVDLDSQDPKTITLLKELGIISEYELPDKSTGEDEIDPEEFYRVQINKEPVLFQVMEIPKKDFTLDNVKKIISEKLSIPLDTIKNLYCYEKGILVENQKLLKITTTFIVQLVSGKFYGH